MVSLANMNVAAALLGGSGATSGVSSDLLTAWAAAKAGLGFLIWQAWQTFTIEEMYVGLVTIAVLGMLSFWETTRDRNACKNKKLACPQTSLAGNSCSGYGNYLSGTRRGGIRSDYSRQDIACRVAARR